MSIKTRIRTTRQLDDGSEQLIEEIVGESIVEPGMGDLAGLIDMTGGQVFSATECIYCGSQDSLSDEHVIPYALGGDWIIKNGTCEGCRKKTQRFEQRALRGELSQVRRGLGIHSRTKHASASEDVTLKLTTATGVVEVRVSSDQTPIVFSLPLLSEPGLLAGHDNPSVQHSGWLVGHVGRDPEAFLREHGATEVTFAPKRNSPSAFACLLARIAYAYAWVEGILERVAEPRILAFKMLNAPNELGPFVGMKSGHRTIYRRGLHRLELKWENGHIICEVQLFAMMGHSTYQVVLGACTLRQWRRARMQRNRAAERQAKIM